MVGRMSRTTEAFSRVKIDALLKDAGWNLTDGVSVLFEHALPDGSRADYALCDRSGRPVAAVEAKRSTINPIAAQDQGRHWLCAQPLPKSSTGHIRRLKPFSRRLACPVRPQISRTTRSGRLGFTAPATMPTSIASLSSEA